MRRIIFSLIIFISFIVTTNVSAFTVVFIHGTRSGYMTMEDARDYWTQKFIDTVRKGHPYFLSHRHGERYLKEQSTETANQLYHNVKDSQIVVVAHSMGNLVIRYIMANPTSDGLTSYQRYQMNVVRNKVRRIVGLAGPHEGSNAAIFVAKLRSNIVTKTIAGWIGYDRDAMEDLLPSKWRNWNRGMLHPRTLKRSNGTRVHYYNLGSRDASAGQPWYNRELENWALMAIDGIISYGSAHNSYYDRYPSKRVCVRRYWWGGCRTRKTVYGDGEVDNDGMVSVESGIGYNITGKDGYWHSYTSYDSHHTNRRANSVAQWAKQFIY